MAKPVTKLLTVIALTAPAAANPTTAPTAPTAGVRAAAAAGSPQHAPAVVATGAPTPTAAPGRPGWFAAEMPRLFALVRAQAPRTLASGAPACGNVMTKAYRPECEGEAAAAPAPAPVVAERTR